MKKQNKTNRISAVICSLVVAMFYFQLSALAVVNSLTVKEEDGVTTANYPMQIGRPFMPGEIPHFPQVRINGVAVVTQADVKQRYSDGSVKHAILTFLIPQLDANSTITIIFRDQLTGNNSPFLTSSDMLQNNFDFEAAMDLNNGSNTITTSARTMVQNNAFTYWMQGSVATSVVIADHSANRMYDIGFDAFKSFRPVFHATFFPGINKVRVRFVGEIANTEAMEDMIYSLILKTGNTSSATVYTKPTFTHYGASRWTKEYWIGGAPSRISINENLGYLKETMFFPNYDTSKVISQTTLANDYANWQTAPQDLFDNGQWMKAMGSGGARPDIGPTTSWAVQWLYSGDIRSQEISFKQADLACAWPVHLREGNPSKLYFRNDPNTKGLGKPISITDRPTTCFACGYNYNYTAPQDKIVPVGSWTDGGWVPEEAHQPDICSPHYILTGDYFYLEEMYFWASWTANVTNGAATSYSWGRGPTGAEGGLTGQIRGQAWSFRNRALAVFCAPDNTDEKKYFDVLCKDAIEIWEGAHDLQNSPNVNSTNWNWGKQYRFDAVMGNPPLHQWERGASAFAQPAYGIDTAVTVEAISNFEQHYMMSALGRGRELGYNMDELIKYFAVHYVGQVTAPGYNKYLLCDGRVPTVDKSGQYFSTWSSLKTGYDATWQNKSSYDLLYPYDYTFLGLTALSYIKCEPGGDSAWAVAQNLILPAPVLNTDPKFAIIPRSCSSNPTSVSDVNNYSGEFEVYPNPSVDGKFWVSIPSGQISSAKSQISRVEVYTSLGEKIYSTIQLSNHSTIDVSLPLGLGQGVYFIHVSQNNVWTTKPIVIQ